VQFRRIIVVLALLAAEANATTFAPLTDEELALSSRAIVVGRVTQVQCASDPQTGLVFTYVGVQVERCIKGELPGGIVLKQLGGATDRALTYIAGAPQFDVGARGVFFLNTDPAGALHIAHLRLGDFRILESGAIARPLERAGSPKSCERAESFVDRIAGILAHNPLELAQYDARWKDVPLLSVPAEFTAKSGTSRFTTLRPGFRWFEPDSRGTVRYILNPRNAPVANGGRIEAQEAAATWSSVSGSSLEVQATGETSACGFRKDGVNSISFGDCASQIDDPVNCRGVVALGGVADANPGEIVTIGGLSYARAREGDIIFNNGFECLLMQPGVLAEVLAHEMGHSLGFGHSSEDIDEPNPVLADAAMYFVTHNDGRGASVRQDDSEGVRFLYKDSGQVVVPLAIVTDALPDAVIGLAYAFDIEARGTSPITWELVGGALPAGVSLSSGGRLSGIPQVAETATFTLQVRSGNGESLTRRFVLRTTTTPAPFLSKASFKESKGKLKLTGLHLSESVLVSVNGRDVAPPARIKFSATKGTLTITGTAGELGVRTGAPNTVVVTISGQVSNVATF
jgi:hypothetical protein